MEHRRRLAILGTLVSSVCHELNNILTPVLTHAELAKQSPSDSHLVRRALVSVVAGVERATEISEAILSLAIPRRPSNDFVVNVSETASAALCCLVRDPAQDGIEVLIDIPSGLNVVMPRVALHQVLLNLLMNARNAIGRVGGRIRIHATKTEHRSTRNTPSETGFACIEVEDNGCGIPPGLIDRVLEPFVTFGEPQHRSSSGHGLGLAICRELVEGAGGRIFVRSEVGRGTCVTLLLRLAAETHAAKAA